MKKETWENIGCLVGIIAFVAGVVFLFYYKNDAEEEEKKAKAEAFLRQEEEKKEQERKAAEVESVTLGRYLYVDAYQTIHRTNDCYVIFDREIGHVTEEESSNCGLRRIRVGELKDINIANFTFCSHCVNDKLYEKIKDINEGEIKYLDLCP